MAWVGGLGVTTKKYTVATICSILKLRYSGVNLRFPLSRRLRSPGMRSAPQEEDTIEVFLALSITIAVASAVMFVLYLDFLLAV
jgi:hypothetical protein